MKALQLPKLAIKAIFLFAPITFVKAQNVGIGTITPHKSAALEISSKSKGLLIPHVALLSNIDDETVSTPATGLLVYNINKAMQNGNGEGYYYNDSKNPDVPNWVKLVTTTSDVWFLNGNTGTNPASNFIGTTDNKDVIFKRDNMEGLRITTGGALLATGNITTGVTPVSGAGTRMMWIPEKAAFRVGEVEADEWDHVNIGENSVAMGRATIASGKYSTAMGSNTQATAFYSTAMGVGTVASGWGSTAMGVNTFATESNSTAIGVDSRASGLASTAMGSNTQASGYYATSMGQGTLARIRGQLVIGRYNKDIMDDGTTVTSTKKVFVIGNGLGPGEPERNDAMFVRYDGNVTIAGTLSQNSDIRLKEDITPLQNVLNTLSNIQPISYYFKDKEKHPASRQIGFSAQEIEKTYPELVSKGDAGYLSVNYPQMTAVAIQAVKELKAENDEVKKQLKALQDEMIELKKAINKAP